MTMKESGVVRAAAVQIAPDLEVPGRTLDRVLEAMAEAAGRGAQLVVRHQARLLRLVMRDEVCLSRSGRAMRTDG